uniref:DUF2793 domain-containing protein n=1 Tax=Mongoliimonas terrestris TaxID=1709001 RepID=UPI00094992B9
MSETANLKLPLLAADQAQKHVTHNEALTALDALVQLAVASRTTAAPPSAPAAGDRYLVPTGGTGAFAGMEGRIARFDGTAWAFETPRDGWLAVVADERRVLARLAGAWIDLADFAWLVATGGSARARVNKAAAGDTGSLMFQTGWSGRAEFGLIADDDLALKVSHDGADWREAMRVDRTSGRVAFALGSQRVEVATFTASGTWTKPAWARRVVAVLVAGGGGGGSGRRGAAGTERRGGGGGGAGGWSREEWLADELPATLTVEIGAGGPGAAARTVNDTNGVSGGAGGTTVIRDGGDNLLTADRGGSGAGGVPGGSMTGWGGGGSFAGSNNGGQGGAPTGAAGIDFALGIGPGGGGGGGGLATTGGAAGAGGNGSRGYRVASSGVRVAAGGAGGTAGNGGADGWDR